MCKNYTPCTFTYMGGFNARTGTLNEFVELDQLSHVECDLLPSHYLEDTGLPFRQNVDKVINDQGKQLLDTCIESKLRILNGRMIGESLGYNTYFSPRGSSSIDYFILSEDLIYEFDIINVCPPTELSDHCVIWCDMKTDVTYGILNNASKNVYDKLPCKFIVEKNTKQKYIQSLTDYESSHMLQQFLNNVENDNISIDSLTNQFSTIIHLSAVKSTKFKTYGHHKNKKKFKKNDLITIAIS